jgi:membrane protein
LNVTYDLLKESWSAWAEDDAPSRGAALAFYAIFSLSPVVIVVVAIAGLVFGHKAAESEILLQLQAWVGDAGARAIKTFMQSADRPVLGVAASMIAMGTILVGASGAFVELQDALDKIWRVKRRSGSAFLQLIRKHFLSFALVLSTGFLLLVSLVLSAALGAAGKFAGNLLPRPVLLLELLNSLLTFSAIMLLLATIFKFVPHTQIAWRDVWIGAAIASLLFTIGKTLIGFYLGRSSMASSYGAAGSLVIVLAWIYYSAQIFLYGAEVTHVYANKYGSRAERVTPTPAPARTEPALSLVSKTSHPAPRTVNPAMQGSGVRTRGPITEPISEDERF